MCHALGWYAYNSDLYASEVCFTTWILVSLQETVCCWVGLVDLLGNGVADWGRWMGCCFFSFQAVHKWHITNTTLYHRQE